MPNHSSLYSGLSATALLVPAVRTADANSTAIDTRDSEDVALLFVLGDSADTLSGSVKLECEVQESDDNSTFTAVANADLTNSVTGTNVGTPALIDAPAEDQTVVIVGYKGYKRYVRGTLNFTGTHTTGIPTAVIGLKGRNRLLPANVSS